MNVINLKEAKSHRDEEIRQPVRDQNAAIKPETSANITQFELSRMLYTSTLFASSDLNPTSKLVLWALCQYYNPKNRDMFPSQATLAKKLGISEKSVERAVKELKGAGLVTYETKYVNHYIFSEKFFNTVKMSGCFRQNVGEEHRQNVGQTNNFEKRNNKNSFFKNSKNFKDYKNSFNEPAVKAPSLEITQKLLADFESSKQKSFEKTPRDYSFKEAERWISGLDIRTIKISKTARFLIEKFNLKIEGF